MHVGMQGMAWQQHPWPAIWATPDWASDMVGMPWLEVMSMALEAATKQAIVSCVLISTLSNVG